MKKEKTYKMLLEEVKEKTKRLEALKKRVTQIKRIVSSMEKRGAKVIKSEIDQYSVRFKFSKSLKQLRLEQEEMFEKGATSCSYNREEKMELVFHY